jgi:ADP-heptose:LPS heptosyltransferase
MMQDSSGIPNGEPESAVGPGVELGPTGSPAGADRAAHPAGGDRAAHPAGPRFGAMPAGWDTLPRAEGGRKPFERALVIRFGRIGDMLVLTPALRALHRAHPAGSIDVLTSRDGEIALGGNPHVRDVLVFRRRRLPPLVNVERARLLRVLRHRRYDVVFLFETAERYRRLARAIGVQQVFSFARDDEDASSTLAVRRPDRHEGLRFLDVIALAGIPPDGVHYDFAIAADARQRAARTLREAGIPDDAPIAGIHAGHFQRRRRSRPHAKAWPVARYAAVVHGLRDRGVHVVLTGSSAERTLNERILAALDSGEAVPPATGGAASVIDISGRTDLATLAAIIDRCAVFVAPDTGPAHLAAAVGTPVVALFGPKAPYIMGPLGDPARIVRLHPEPSPAPDRDRDHYHPRMWAIGVQDVLAALDTLLRTRQV